MRSLRLTPTKNTPGSQASNQRTIAIRSEIKRGVEHTLRFTEFLRRVTEAAPHHAIGPECIERSADKWFDIAKRR